MLKNIVKVSLLSMLVVGSLNASMVAYLNKSDSKMNVKEEMLKSNEVIEYFSYMLNKLDTFDKINSQNLKKFALSFVHPNDKKELKTMSDRDVEKYIVKFLKIADKISKKQKGSTLYLEIKDYGKDIKVTLKNKIITKQSIKVSFKRVNNKLYTY